MLLGFMRFGLSSQDPHHCIEKTFSQVADDLQTSFVYHVPAGNCRLPFSVMNAGVSVWPMLLEQSLWKRWLKSIKNHCRRNICPLSRGWEQLQKWHTVINPTKEISSGLNWTLLRFCPAAINSELSVHLHEPS